MIKKTPYITVLLLLIIILSCLTFADEGKKDGHGQNMIGTASPAKPEEPADEVKKIVAARVNGADISLRSVTELMNVMGVQKGQGHGREKPIDKEIVRKEALDRLIFEELAFQKAINEGLKVDPAEIEKNIADIRERLRGEEAFRKTLLARRMTEEKVRTDIARNILLQKIFKAEIFDKTPAVSDNEIEKAYEQEKDKFVVAEKIVVIDAVLFLNPEDRGSIEKAEHIRKRILEDKEQNPLNLIPDGTFIVKESEVKEEKQPEIHAEALRLKVGELSGIIETSDSMHIIKLKEYVPEKRFALSEMKGFLESSLKAAARKKRLHEWEMELRKEATIEMMDGNK